jgi:hypothetical protein
MEPNVYESPKSEPLSAHDYQAAREATGRTIPEGIMLATILASVASGSLTAWGATCVMTAIEAAAQASVAKVGPSLTGTGHAAFLTFGGIIGLVTGFVAVGLAFDHPPRHSRYILPMLAAVFASLLSFVALCLVASVFFSPPRDLMDLLFQ